MKHKLLIVLTGVALLFASCKEDEPVFVASAEVNGVTINTHPTSADIQWKITSEATIDRVILEYDKDSSFANSVHVDMVLKNSSKYQVTLISLSANTKYYVRCQVINKYSHYLLPDIHTFTTKPYSAPTVTTSAPTNISFFSATCGGNVTDDGGNTITERGICYSTTSNPTTSDSKVTSTGTVGSFTCSLTGLINNTKYYVRAYAKNSKGTSYGSEKSFTTQELSAAIISYTASSKLTEVTSESSSGLHTNAFGAVSIVSHDFSDGQGTIRFSGPVISIGDHAFYSCYDLTSITIPNSVTSIGGGAFSECRSLTSIAIPNSVTSIGSGAFTWCDELTSINVASGNNYYSSSNGVLFNYAKTTLITYPCGKAGSYSIPSSVTGIGDYAFMGCYNLTSVTIPNSVTCLGEWVFASCRGVTSITIPSNVTIIGDGAFFGCKSLTSITCRAITPPTCDGSDVFYDVNKSIPVYVPTSSVSAYKTANCWKDFTNIQSL